MRTVKEVSKLTGVSIRTLQYYDKIGLLKPSERTDSGYRLYEDRDISKLQQILFFKELDFSLNDIKVIMDNPNFNKTEVYRQQKELLKVQYDRLEKILKSLEELEEGKEVNDYGFFDLSNYFKLIEQFKVQHIKDILKEFKSVEEFDNLVQKMKKNEEKIVKLAVKQYGSIKNYTGELVNNINNFSKNAENMEKHKKLIKELVSDTTQNFQSDKSQNIVKKIVKIVYKMDIATDWEKLIEAYLNNIVIIENFDKQYGMGASQFIGNALNYYFANN